MDRNYPASGFGDPLGTGQGWSYDRTSSGVKASLVYGGSRSSHPETDILHRQAYATPHPLQGYATNHHPAGLSGLFETGLHHAGSSTPDASVMNLISALESRAPQPGPSASSLLSQFRTPSWQTAMHTPGPAELFISGAIPGSGTFPSSSALSAYQHPASFSGRSFPVTSSLTLQDATFSPSSNGLLSPHDPLLHIKSSQSSVPSSLTFDRLGSAVLGTGLPSQSSAYRTAQESASRHLQSQFNLLSSPLGPSDQASQLYNTSVFSASPASGIERAIPRQDSVIKHYQRPSSAQAQLPASHHSLQHYLSCGGSHSFQQMPRHSSLSCSPLGEQSPVSSEGSQKSSQARAEHSQSYRPIIQSPGYSSSSSSSKSKSYSASRQAQRSAATPKCQSISSTGQSHNYSSSTPKPSSVISSQPQAYSPGQSQNLLTMSQQPQSYSVTQAQNMASVTQSQGFASSQSQDLTTVSKAQSYSGSQAQSLQTCVSQAQNYSPDQLQGLSSVGSIQSYSVQSEPHPSVTQGQSYVPAHSQGMPSASPSLSYATGHSPGMSSHGQSIVYSSASHVQSLSESSPSQIIRPLQSPTGSRSQSVASPGQSQKYLSSVLSPSFIQSSHSQSFQSSQSPLERAPSYGKAKSDSDLLSSERTEDEDFLIQHLLDSQSPPRVSSQGLAECEDRASKSLVYEMSKSEERYHLQSVIRTNSSLDNQVLEMSLQGLKEKKKAERQKEYGHSRPPSEALVTSVVHYSHQPNSLDSLAQDIKKSVDHLQTSHLEAAGKEIGQAHAFLQKTPEQGSRSHHMGPEPPQMETHGILQGQQGSQMMLDTSPEMQLAHQPSAQQSQLLQSVLTHTQNQMQQHKVPTPMDVHMMESQRLHSEAQSPQLQLLEVHLQNQQMAAHVRSQAMEVRSHPSSLDSRLLDSHQIQPEPPSPQLQGQLQAEAMEGLPQPEGMQSQEMQEFLEPDLHLESHLAQGGQVQSQQHLLPEPNESLQLDGTEPSRQVAQQQLEQKDQFSSASPQSSKQRFVPLTSICFPDSLLQDEERNFFPGMEDMFCSAPCGNEEYSKQSCGDEGGQAMDRNGGLKSGFEMMHSNQSFSGYCTSEAGGGQQSVHLDLNSVSMKPELEPAEHLGMAPQGHGPTSADIKSPLTTASFCSMKTKKFLKTSSLHLLKKKDSPPQPPKKTYAQEYEFEDEEKEDVPADIRLNNRRLPDLLPDLISSCRTRTNISPVSDIDFCAGNNLNGGKKKTKRASKPKEKGPPRPRGRPRIRPLEPPQGVAQEGPKKRGRGRGRGKKVTEDENEGFKMEKQVKQSKGKVQGSKASDLLPIEAPEALPAESVLENSQTQEKIKKKIKEVEEKQPEMKSGFMASFLDFLKSGKRQQLPATTSSPQKGRPSSVINQPAQIPFGLTQSMLSGQLDASESDSLMSCTSPCKRFDDDLKKNLETLPSFSSDEEDSVSKNQDLQKSITSAISALYDPMDRKENDNTVCVALPDNMAVEEKEASPSPSEASQPEQAAPPTPVLPKEPVPEQEPSPAPESPPQPEEKEALSPVKLAKPQDSVAICGETDEDDEESGGEGAIRKWDEFVIKIDDIKELKLAMQEGNEPPPIWRVQKASLQQFMPEVRDGQRHFCSSAQYIEYPDEVKNDYQRLYVKFLENVDKKDYVRICSKKPWHRPLHLAKKQDSVAISGETDEDDEESGGEGVFRERDEFVVKIDDVKALKVKPKPYPHLGRQQLAPLERIPTGRILNTRAMKEMYKSYIELLVSAALDPAMIETIEANNDELYLPTMKKIDGILTDHKKRVTKRVSLSSTIQEGLQTFPQLVVEDSEADRKDNPAGSVKLKVAGAPYNRKTLNQLKKNVPRSQDFQVEAEKLPFYTLFHSLHHYKYHTLLHCKEQTDTLSEVNEDLGQEEIVQQCMRNVDWLEKLFDSFSELLTQVQQQCA
uniref:proline-rich protein 12-like n=1 Tax=Pristiophorus japonicus TaxID=55135 RepID=UPI00398E58A4